jgi:hypothetical protein
MRKVVLGSTRQDLALRLENHQHRLPFALVFPQVPEQILIPRLVLANPLQATFDEPLYVLRVQCQPQVEPISVVSVVLTYGRSALEHLPVLHRRRAR